MSPNRKYKNSAASHCSPSMKKQPPPMCLKSNVMPRGLTFMLPFFLCSMISLMWPSIMQKEQNLAFKRLNWSSRVCFTGCKLSWAGSISFSFSFENFLGQFWLCLPWRQYSLKTGVCVRHCNTLFAKHVLPMFYRPGNTSSLARSRFEHVTPVREEDPFD